MAGDKEIQTTEVSAPPMMSDSAVKLPEEEMGKDGIPSESVSSVPDVGNAISGTEGAIDQQLASEQGVYYPPTSCYDYYYPRYNGTFVQSDDKSCYNKASGSYTGVQPGNTSLLYYLPGYGPYTASEYLQQPCLYGSEAFPCYTYDMTYAGTGLAGAAARSGSAKSNGCNTAKVNNNLSSKASALPFNSKLQQPASHFSRSSYQNQSINPLNKLGFGYQSSGLSRGQFGGRFSSFTNRNPGAFAQYGPLNYQSNGREWNNSYRYKSRENFDRNGDAKARSELIRGPRADNRNNSSKLPSEVEQLAFAVDRNKYNLQEFQTEYDSAKFYVIRSYSEDDVHKCIKYDVWSSTPNGNKKLDAAFREADAKTSDTGTKCPIFLFFSVNGSGQFVGVAEMIGPVDFSKNMDFWQLDKWNGFFPIKWHIIKDVPNRVLQHIILENNENRAVTYSRDTQEIGLKQGLEMLSIFKSYSERTSVLDDFNFYENREKVNKPKRINGRTASQTNGFKNGDHKKRFENGEQSGKTISQSDPSSLISLTKNLSLNPQPL